MILGENEQIERGPKEWPKVNHVDGVNSFLNFDFTS